MWPLQVREIERALAPEARLRLPTQDVRSRLLMRAISWAEPSLNASDLFFALDPTLAIPALSRSAVCVVPEGTEVPPHLEARVFLAENPLRAFRHFAGWFRQRLTMPVVAVAGSNGKTTTKDMLVHLLQNVSFTTGTNNGWEGTPVTLCHHLHTHPLPRALILEIGIDAKGAMREHVAISKPDVAVITALGIEHLAGLGSHEEAIQEELELVAPVRIHHADEPRIPRDVAVECSWRPGELLIEGVKIELAIPGRHNGRNAALAIATARHLGLTLPECAERMRTFELPPQRCAIQTLATGAILIDDTYNANPDSVLAALDVLESFPDRERIVVLGDMLDLGDHAAALHAALEPRLKQLGARFVLIGEHVQKLDLTRVELADLEIPSSAVILVKGSRALHLERVVQEITARSSRT